MFITFEGGEGSGKTSAMNYIEETLKSLGYEIVRTREPGGTPIAEEIRNVIRILSRKTKNITSELKTNTKLDKSMKHKNGRRDELTDTQRFNMEEVPSSIEEITVHVPRVTPEMEKEYLNRNKR